MIYCSIVSDVGKVQIPVSDPDPDLCIIYQFFNKNKIVQKSCLSDVRSSIISQKSGLSFLIFFLFYTILCRIQIQIRLRNQTQNRLRKRNRGAFRFRFRQGTKFHPTKLLNVNEGKILNVIQLRKNVSKMRQHEMEKLFRIHIRYLIDCIWLGASSSILRGHGIVGQREDERSISLHIHQQIVDIHQQEVDALLAERGVDEHLAQLGEQAQQMDGAVGADRKQTRVLGPVLKKGEAPCVFLSSERKGIQ